MTEEVLRHLSWRLHSVCRTAIRNGCEVGYSCRTKNFFGMGRAHKLSILQLEQSPDSGLTSKFAV